MTMTADVKLGEDLERVLVCPRRHADALDLTSELRTALGGVRLRRSAEGIVVPANAATRMVDLPDLDLRWSEEAFRFVQNRRSALAQHESFRQALAALRQDSRPKLEARLAAIEALGELDDHQVLNVAAMTHALCVGLCLFDEQGAGKTVSAICAWDYLAATDQMDFALIIAPKSMVTEWRQDLERFRPGMYSLAIATGSRADKRRALRQRPDVLITNFETAISLEHELLAHLRRFDGRALLIVDESFFVKNRDARRTRALRRLREWCGRAFVLCGTPAPNAPHDVIEQFNLADHGATFGDVEVPDDRDLAHAVVNDALEHRGAYLRSLKQDVLPDLPDKAFEIVRLPLAPIQRRAYDAALTSLLLDLRSEDEDGFRKRLTSYMARRAALLQICSNPARIIDGYAETPAKLAALDELLPSLLKDREKVVIWSSYRTSLDSIVERYSGYGLARYDGSVTDVAARREAIRAFQEDPGTRLFVGNPAAAGAGLTLHSARIAIYESLTNQAAHYLQSLDRIHRRGQSRAVRYIVMLGEATIEEPDFETLRRKEREAQHLLGDAVEPPLTLDRMLDYLTAAVDRAGLRLSVN